MKKLSALILIIVLLGCAQKQEKIKDSISSAEIIGPHIVVLGIAQDAGFPQTNCKKSCCKDLWTNKKKRRTVSSIGLRNPADNKSWLFDATPDFTDQVDRLQKGRYTLDGIFLTHAHIGHYTGLMYLGREAMGANQLPVYTMPKMKSFLKDNGPWSQLVSLKNISLQDLKPNEGQRLNNELVVTPILVPHRDEFSETVGYSIQGPSKNALFIPDIDKWSKWNESIIAQFDVYDFLLLDGSFYDNNELPNRDMSEIPHPFVVETMVALEGLPKESKAKLHFIHLNHTNPLLDTQSPEYQEVIRQGFKVCEEGEKFFL